MSAFTAPLAVERVALTVRDLDGVAGFYEHAIGLETISRDGETVSLGVDGAPLIELRRDRNARSLPFEAGLFHTAFLLPHRDDLGRWLGHFAEIDGRLDGASDHLVSEAVYLRDPEGNGIEIYADRPRSEWTRNGAMVAMDTRPLDLPELARAPGRWAGAPRDTVVGHVHLQVGDPGMAEAFYRDRLGFDLSSTIPGARFFATGGYHHHIATNVWNSRGAGMRSPDAAGLAELTLSATGDVASRLERDSFVDPWGNRIAIKTRNETRSAAG